MSASFECDMKLYKGVSSQMSVVPNIVVTVNGSEKREISFIIGD